MKFAKFLLIVFLSLALTLPIAHDAYAKKRKVRSASSYSYNPKYSDIVVNADTGKVLHDDASTALRHPASLTKMMTLYLLFEKLHSKQISLSDRMYISAEAASRPQTNLSLTAGDKIEVEDAIHAMVIRSANDVAVVIAENIAGSEQEFARLMTTRARQLGMKNTTFRNASGLHNPGQVTTARDLALLGIALRRHFPEYYHYFSEESFDFHDKTYNTHNRVVLNYAGADGIKTGFVTASGFNLVTSATRRGTNLVGVVLGGRSGATRDQKMMALLDEAFAKSANDKFGDNNKELPNYNYSAANSNIPQGDNTEDDDTSSNSAATEEPKSYTAAQTALNSPKATDAVVKKIEKKKSTKKKTSKKKKKKKKKSSGKAKSSQSSR